MSYRGGMRRSRTATALLTLLLVACGTMNAPPDDPAARPIGGVWDSSLRVPGDPFRGFGAWVDVFDRELWADPEGTVEEIAGRGIRTLYLQTASTDTKRPIRYPRLAARFLDAARSHGIRTVAWYLPKLLGAPRDLRRGLAAAAFSSPNGSRFDGVAVDIEVTAEADDEVRAQRLLGLSRQLRAIVGRQYPLGAIVPSPIRGPDFWPILPVRELSEIYDAVLPMAYWTFHVSGEDDAHAYISRSVRLLRDEAGPEVPIHVIGGIADPATPAELRGFVRAIEESGVIGASVYDVDTTDDRGWAALEGLG